MKKLSMIADDLRVDSFTTDAPDAGRGTVQGAQLSAAGTCLYQDTCRCTQRECLNPSEPGYATIVNNVCVRC